MPTMPIWLGVVIGVDFVVFDSLKRRLHRVNVVDGEEASDAQNTRE